MNMNNAIFSIVITLIFSLAGCSNPSEPVPTIVPMAELPSPTSTTLPPTIDISTVTGTPIPTELPPTTLPSSSPTPFKPQISITSPEEGTDLVIGSEVIVQGLAQLQANETISLALTSWNGRLLVDTQAVIQDKSWGAGIFVPPFVSGAAHLEVTLQDASGSILAEDRSAVNLVIDSQTTERFLALYHPTVNETAVGGFNLFFDGIIYRPTNSAVAISVWVDDCQTRVARQSFALGASVQPFYWQGFVIIPEGTVGPACAVAHFGETGSEDWREAVMPIAILPTEDENAKGIRISTPADGSHSQAGHELLLYGTALNASDKPVSVRILMENGRIINQSTAPADSWGYWEFRVTMPPDVSGPAKVTISAGDPGTAAYVEEEILIILDPAPTPGA